MTRRTQSMALLSPLFLLTIGACSQPLSDMDRLSDQSASHVRPDDPPGSSAAKSNDGTPAVQTGPNETTTRSQVVQATVQQRVGLTDFDGQRSYDILKTVCGFGRRTSHSPGMTKQQAYLTHFFQELGATVTRQEFSAPHPVHGTPVPMANLIVSWHPDTTQRVLLCAHYDTRPFPDQDPDPRGRRGEFLGANDGASGVACLAELGHHLLPWDRDLGVDFVFFDGEEYVFRRRDKYFYGSEHFAKQYVANPPGYAYRWGILLDMVADAELHLYQERNSVSWPDTRPLVDSIWKTAAEMGVREFIAKPEYAVQDDHLALRNIAGIPTCDIIDFYYPRPGTNYWHTRADRPENCSADSLHKVGSVLLRWLRSQK